MARSLRSQLYRSARILGDLEAASKGPGAYAKRVIRKKTYGQTMGVTNSLFRFLKKR
jgi:hypothetical protein